MTVGVLMVVVMEMRMIVVMVVRMMMVLRRSGPELSPTPNQQ
jgi:hypothetical protein